MSPSSARVVQYGKRFSLKKKASLEYVDEPSPKRQKLVDDRPCGEDHLLSQQTTSTVANVAVLETVRPQNVSVTGSSTGKTSIVKPSKIVGRSGSPAAPDVRDSPPLLEVDVEDGEKLSVVFPNTPERLQSLSTATGSSHKPSCSPKDLSGIFAPLSQLSSPSRIRPFTTPTKSLTKRMLVRSRTEPTLLSPATSPHKSALKPSLSVSAISSLLTSSEPQQPLLHPSPQSPSPVASRSTLRTYSQSRSFLVPLPVSVTARPSSSSGLSVIQDTTSQHDDEEVRESYTDLRARWGVDNSEGDLSHISGQTNDLLSITELRSKGESRRFLDEVGYLFEGLEERGLAASVRRSSAAEIVTKMCDPEFMRMAKAADFIGHAWDSMREAGAGDGDKVLDLYLVAFVALVARDKRDLDELSCRKGFFDTMLRMLQYPKKIDGFCIQNDVDARKAGFSKSEWIAVSNLRDTIVTKSDLLASYSVPSTRLFASYTMSRIAPIIYPQRILSPLLDTLIGELQLLRHKTGTEMPSVTADLDHVDYCLVILDACLLGSSGPKYGTQLVAVQSSLCSGLSKLCVTLQNIPPDTEQGNTVYRTMEDALRVLISLSHLSTGLCERLVEDPALLHVLVCQIISVTSAVMKQDSDEVYDKARSLDRQCLALALLSNLSFVVGNGKDRLRNVSLSVSCTGRQHCALSCHCAQRANAITVLTTLFVKMAITSESSELDFFQCHLAALLCLLTIGNSDNEVIIRRELMKANGPELLKSSVGFFLKFYEAVKGPIDVNHTLSEDDMQQQVESACAVLCR